MDDDVENNNISASANSGDGGVFESGQIQSVEQDQATRRRDLDDEAFRSSDEIQPVEDGEAARQRDSTEQEVHGSDQIRSAEQDASPRQEPLVDEELQNSDDIQPVKEDEAIRRGYPALTFRFITLTRWFLILTFFFWFAVIAGVLSLTVLHYTNPWSGFFHVRTRGYFAFRYTPGIIGTMTTIWWRPVTQSYNRLIPYVTMADSSRDSKVDEHGQVIIGQQLNNLDPSVFAPGGLIALARHGQGTTLSVTLTQVEILVLVPLKSGLLQMTQDEKGWSLIVSPFMGMMIIAVYLCLAGTTLAVLVRLWDESTGLKWNPSSLAAQVGLLQYSDIHTGCDGMEFCDKWIVSRRTWEWSQQLGNLRLGYWKNKNKPDDLFHCIRFIKLADGNAPTAYEDALQRLLIQIEGVKSRQRHKNPRMERRKKQKFDDEPLHRYMLETNDYPEMSTSKITVCVIEDSS